MRERSAFEEDLRNQDGIGEKELLVVSFGTSFNENRRVTIGAVEDDLEEAFPDFSVRRGLTSRMIIDHVFKRDGVKMDSVEEALKRAVRNRVHTLAVQPTHLMDGVENTELAKQVARYADFFDRVTVGEPLLSSEEDFERVIRAVTEDTASFDDGHTAIVLMGHGTDAPSNQVYPVLQEKLLEKGFRHYYVGTVEAAPGLGDMFSAVKKGDYTRVVLQPLMIVAGDHATHDMAGDQEGSWKRAFEDAGYQVICSIKGLGEMKAIRQVFVDHARTAMKRLFK